MNILEKTIIVNGRENKILVLDELVGEKKEILIDDDFSEVFKNILQSTFKTHKNLYAKFGISYENALYAGWHPDDEEFGIDCAGFKKALKDKFEIKEKKSLKRR